MTLIEVDCTKPHINLTHETTEYHQSAANSETRTKPSRKMMWSVSFCTSVWLRESERVITVRDQARAHLHRWSRCSVYTDSGLIMESTSVPKHCLLRFPLISPHLLKSSWQETCRRGKAPTPPTSYLSLLCLANLSSASSYTNYKCKRLSISMLKEIWLNLIALTLGPFGKWRNTCGGVVNAHLVAF